MTDNKTWKSPAFSYGWYQEQVDQGTAVSLAEQNDVIRVSTEHLYVLLDPLERRYLVKQGVVAWSVAVVCAQEPWNDSNEVNCNF